MGLAQTFNPPSFGICEPYRLQGSFCAQVAIYRTLMAEAYAQQPPSSSPNYQDWVIHINCLQSMEQIAMQYCSQFGGDGTFPMCSHEYAHGWSCQALSHYTNALNQLNALPPTFDTQQIWERDRLRACLTFIVNNLQVNCSGGQFNVPHLHIAPPPPSNPAPPPPSDPGGVGSGGGVVPGHPGYDPLRHPPANKPGGGAFSSMDECEFTSLIDIADHCTRARLLLEMSARLQSEGRLSDRCRQRLNQMYLDEAGQCERAGGNPTGEPPPVPLKPYGSGKTPAHDPTSPCTSLSMPDTADPCVLVRYVFEAWQRAQQMRAPSSCLQQLKTLFYEKYQACQNSHQPGHEFPHQQDPPR